MSWGDDDDYQQWLEDTCLEDTDENREWFDCPEDERGQWMEEHPDF